MRKGQTVYHKDYGYGTIITVGNNYIRVDFISHEEILDDFISHEEILDKKLVTVIKRKG